MVPLARTEILFSPPQFREQRRRAPLSLSSSLYPKYIVLRQTQNSGIMKWILVKLARKLAQNCRCLTFYLNLAGRLYALKNEDYDSLIFLISTALTREEEEPEE